MDNTNGDEKKIRKVMTAIEVSEIFFGGAKSAWAILAAARKRQLPSLRIGRRVYFDSGSIEKFVSTQSETSVQTAHVVHGIRKL